MVVGTLGPRMRSLPALVLCTAIVGCSPASTGATTTVVTAETTIPATTTTTLSPPAARAAFVSCLADAGIEIPAEAFDSAGAPRLGMVAESLDTTAAAVQAAVTECAPLLSAAQAADLAADPEVRILVMEQLAAFTQCMRDQGVADFPDPDSEAEAPYPTDRIPFSAPGYDDALAACQDLVGAFGMASG